MQDIRDYLSGPREAATRLASLLVERSSERIVLAESCTAGLVGALFGQVPGISEFFCGSAVTYRASAKHEWLGVLEETISAHTTESIETSQEMAIGVLKSMGEATLSAAVTGHLGPGAPRDLDGKIFVSIACRSPNEFCLLHSSEIQLVSLDRIQRQAEAANCVLELLLTQLSDLI